MKNQKNKQENLNEEQKTRSTYAVMVPKQHKNAVSTLDFEWPEFKSERERIKAYSKRFKDMSFTEAMTGNKVADIKEDSTPVTPVLGKLYPIDVIVTETGHIFFEGLQTKETLVCRNNLQRYSKTITRGVTHMQAKVVAVDKSRQSVTIDVLQPIFEAWVNDIMADKTEQCDLKNPRITQVSNLRLSNGGFIGKARVDVISDFLGENYYVDAFIPGSQIVLNIENDFEKWNGMTVDTFVTNYSTKPNSVNQMSLICSRKALLNFMGNAVKISLYNDYCSNNKAWKEFVKRDFAGTVTGVINSSKKCGVFVEVPSMNITGMIDTAPEELVKYKAGDVVNVRIIDFEPMTYFDSATNSIVNKAPYEIYDGKVRSCSLKPILQLV